MGTSHYNINKTRLFSTILVNKCSWLVLRNWVFKAQKSTELGSLISLRKDCNFLGETKLINFSKVAANLIFFSMLYIAPQTSFESNNYFRLSPKQG